MKKNNKIQYLLAHGAGAPCYSPWMNQLASEIEVQSNNEIKVVRFNFPYMQRRLLENKKFPPDRMPKLLEEWLKQISLLGPSTKLFIGGKSMGGRASTLLNFSDLPKKVNGIINFGFPFHAPGKDPGDRIKHLENLEVPCLINQGERDPMGTFDEIKTYKLSKKIKLNYLPDGNHDLKPRVRSGINLEQNICSAVKETIKFIDKN